MYFALQRADMTLAMPAHAVFVTQETTDRKAIKTEKQVIRRRQLLASLELFSGLSDAERTELARTMKYAPFAEGEVMTRQGAEAHWLYLMEDGKAVVRVSDGLNDREVAQLAGPCFFGEMSLLTGEPRSATVIADSNVSASTRRRCRRSSTRGRSLRSSWRSYWQIAGWRCSRPRKT